MIKHTRFNITELKEFARALRVDLDARGIRISHGNALEKVARHFGYHDWNTCCAALRKAANSQDVTPKAFSVGDRVEGAYLGCPFIGTIRSATSEGKAERQRIRVHFDRAVNVSKFERFDVLRRHVSASIMLESGTSPDHISTGEPQMVLRHLP